MSDTRDLGLILDARIPIVVIESPDERRVLALLLQFAMQRGLPFSEWSATRGLRRGELVGDGANDVALCDPNKALIQIGSTPGPALYALCDIHPYLNNEPKTIRYIKDIALDYERLGNTLVLVSHALTIPQELGRLTATFNLRLPSDDELLAMLRKQAQEWARLHKGRKVTTDNRTLDKLIANLRGVTHSDAQILIRRAVFADGVISDADIPEINKLKFELLDTEGVLHYEYDTQSFANVAGLTNLKNWLRLRQHEFIKPDGADRPKGLLLLGVQGSGKSLAAKSVAGLFGVPLLRLDFGTLYNKYFGETERNLRNSLQQAELMAPCVLWLDEIEKGIATGDSDNATSKRVLATMLTWMAENKRTGVHRRHVQRHHRAAAGTRQERSHGRDLLRRSARSSRRARRSSEFTCGSAKSIRTRSISIISQNRATASPAPKSRKRSYRRAICPHRIRRVVTTEDVLGAINRTYPMSVLRADSVQALRAWAKDRTVPA